MGTPTGPYVNPKTIITVNIGSTPTIIASSLYKFEVDCLTFINLTQEKINIYTHVLRDINSVSTQCKFRQNITVQPLDSIDIMQYSMLTLEPSDLLYAYAAFSSSQFNAFVKCREYLEVGGN